MSHTINRSQLKLLSHREKTQTTNVSHKVYPALENSSGEKLHKLFWTCLLPGGSVVKSEEAAAVKMRDCKRRRRVCASRNDALQ